MVPIKISGLCIAVCICIYVYVCAHTARLRDVLLSIRREY